MFEQHNSYREIPTAPPTPNSTCDPSTPQTFSNQFSAFVAAPLSPTSPTTLQHSFNSHLGAQASTSSAKMPQYASRDVGDPSQIKKNKQSMADLKLRRLTELNNRLREDLERERIPVSQAAKSIIAYCNSTRDYMVPSVWGQVPKAEDPYLPQQSSGCCVVM
ncbi:GGL domain-containing protein [Copromyces sp. CBS 386.78]|nr:GGL domain-containing protein [Copromyces sp. CBS 386.78]